MLKPNLINASNVGTGFINCLSINCSPSQAYDCEYNSKALISKDIPSSAGPAEYLAPPAYHQNKQVHVHFSCICIYRYAIL